METAHQIIRKPRFASDKSLRKILILLFTWRVAHIVNSIERATDEMWLLDTETLHLKEYFDPETVQYVILSHTWEHEEVSFQEISDLESAVEKAGFSKIAQTCEIARAKGIKYAWVDTCCINKDSSAELSEAINSMFSWYKHATVCLVYLSDMRRMESTTTHNVSTYSDTVSQEAFVSCKWFSRGWTLQELIAPDNIEFYDSQWKLFGTKVTLRDWILNATGISPAVLESSVNLQTTLVAVKLSWAAQRQTKRIEDRAYSLLGILGINMPLIYGEGLKAFRRLQEEIARETDDLSLFAWKPLVSGAPSRRFRGIFAEYPEEFRDCSQICNNGTWSEFTLTNKGVRFGSRMWKYGTDAYLMPLHLIDRSLPQHDLVSILLVRTARGYVRYHPLPGTHPGLANPQNERTFFTLWVQKVVTEQESLRLERRLDRSFRVEKDISTFLEIGYLQCFPHHLWDAFHGTFISGSPGTSSTFWMRIHVRMKHRNPSELFPLFMTMGYCADHNEPFVCVYSDTIPTSNRKSTCALPEGFPDFRKNYPGWDVTSETHFSRNAEATCDRIRTTPDFQSREVYFLRGGGTPHDLSMETGLFVKFSVKLETTSIENGLIQYKVTLSGKLSHTEELGQALHGGPPHDGARDASRNLESSLWPRAAP